LGRLVLVFSLLPTVLPSAAGAAVVTAAGDIASCESSADSATGDLVRAIDPTVALTLGDNVYPDGVPSLFTDCYDPAWGSFKSKTRPSPGNHDYETVNAAGYFGYFARRAGRCCRGYYKFDLGAWRLYSLNSERDIVTQARWLRHDVRAHPHRCTLAYWHRARFSDSTVHGDFTVSTGCGMSSLPTAATSSSPGTTTTINASDASKACARSLSGPAAHRSTTSFRSVWQRTTTPTGASCGSR
jgi:hypothetical protein